MGSSHEIILPNEDLPFKMFTFEGKNGNYVRGKHWHRSIEIFAIFEGSLRFFLNEEEYKMNAGEFLLVNSNEVHSIFSPKPNLTVVIQIPLAVFKKYYTNEQFISFSHEPRVRNQELMELMRRMYDTYINQECGYEFQVQSYFYELLYTLVTEYRNTEVSPEIVRSYRKLSRLTEITDYIKKNYQKELSLESLAETFGYSPTYLSKMFQKYAKINYRDYLQNIRLERAGKELASTDHMINDIALNHGFANSKAFSNAFRKKYGMLPSDYRKKEH